MTVTIRKFDEKDIGNKIKWINDLGNNQFLHYDFPLEYEKTRIWYEGIKEREDRYDAVIQVNRVPVGLIGLISIDRKNKKAEYYISMGEQEFKGKGISTEASKLLLEYAFSILGLKKLYLFTETENIPAHKLFKRIGFELEGYLKNDIFSHGKMTERFAFGITSDRYYTLKGMTPIMKINEIDGNQAYIKRDDLIPYSFGGNKARKAELFFREIDAGDFDYVVTYGSGKSNHCRIVSNMAAERGIPCHIIAPLSSDDISFNKQMTRLFGAEIKEVPIDGVHEAIESKLRKLRIKGRSPYFIAGGGHGNIGTQAYVKCYNEIKAYESREKIFFDYIFLASGTGTTQAGLVAGQIINNDDNRIIIGISIARKNPYGKDVVMKSIRSYLESEGITISEEKLNELTKVVDNYTGGGYGIDMPEILETIVDVMKRYGLPLDKTYTGKAFWGMKEYLKVKGVKDKNILFIHTGGTPLFFDDFKLL